MQNGTRSILLVVFVLVIGVLTPAPTRATGPASTDMTLEVAKGPLTIYDQPNLKNGIVIQSVPLGGRIKWNGTSQEIEGRVWIQVTAISAIGWATPDNEVLFLADPSRITPNIDRSAIFQPVESNLNLWQSPDYTKGTLVGTLPANTQLKVMDGPVITDLYTWWQASAPDGRTGWFADTGSNLQVITPLKVYGYQVCDGFNLKAYGVPNWDSIVNSFKELIPANEKIVCLASTNLKGDNTPLVVVLTHSETADGPHDTLHFYDQQGGNWFEVYKEATESYTKSERISLHNLTLDGKPALLWMQRADGTGGILNLIVYRYVPNVGIQPILTGGGYKGTVQVGTSSVLVIEADYKDNEPNCCPSGIHRMGFLWQNGQFAKVVDDKFRNPYFIQGAPQ